MTWEGVSEGGWPPGTTGQLVGRRLFVHQSSRMRCRLGRGRRRRMRCRLGRGRRRRMRRQGRARRRCVGCRPHRHQLLTQVLYNLFGGGPAHHRAGQEAAGFRATGAGRTPARCMAKQVPSALSPSRAAPDAQGRPSNVMPWLPRTHRQTHNCCNHHTLQLKRTSGRHCDSSSAA